MIGEGPAREVRAALLTAEGRGAIAVVRLWGRDALSLADEVFRPARGPGLAGTRPGRLRFGRLGAGEGDEVVAVVIGGDPPEVEVHCHGGTAAVALVLDTLRERGAEVVGMADWIGRRGGSPLSVQAEIDLARAPTLRAAGVLLEQMEGALEGELRDILARLDDDPSAARSRIDALVARSAVGTRLLDGWRVVLAGRPNVGKSCLLNALAGYERAIVDPTPGTTRDVLGVRTALGGWPVELIDTAGLRASADPIESEGVARARAQHARADLILVVLDRSTPLTAEDRSLIDAWPGALLLANKADLPPSWDAADQGALAISARRGDGIESLVGRIASRLVPESPPPGAGVPFRVEQARSLRRVGALLAGGRVEPARRALARLIGLDAGPTTQE